MREIKSNFLSHRLLSKLHIVALGHCLSERGKNRTTLFLIEFTTGSLCWQNLIGGGQQKNLTLKFDLLSPVDNIPGHGQHASHPGAAHHPAAHKQGGDVDGLEAEDRTNIEVDWLDDILRAEKEKHRKFCVQFSSDGFVLTKSMPQTPCEC